MSTSAAASQQLSSRGPEDQNTTKNPNVTFWKHIQKRHTGFSFTWVFEELSGNGADWGRTINIVIPRKGDLLTSIYLAVDVGPLGTIATSTSAGARFTNDLATWMFEEVELLVGEQLFVKINSIQEHCDYLTSTPFDKRQDDLIGYSRVADSGLAADQEALCNMASSTQRLYKKLRLWFTDNYANAYPVVAHFRTETRLRVKIRAKADCIIPVSASNFANGGTYTVLSSDAILSNMRILQQLVFLTDRERHFFTGRKQKYLITQNQTHPPETVLAGATSKNIELSSFHHPVKKLQIVFHRKDTIDPFDFKGQEIGMFAGEGFVSAKLTVDGSDLVPEFDPIVLRKVIPHAGNMTTINKPGVYEIDFAKDPQNTLNPTGSFNFSAGGKVMLQLKFGAALAEAMDIYIFAKSWNQTTVLKGSHQLTYG